MTEKSINKIETLIEESEGLKKSFTIDDYGSKLSDNRRAVSKWITSCMRIVESAEKQHDKSPIYIKFSKALNSVNSSLFNELVGSMEGINETLEEENSTITVELLD